VAIVDHGKMIALGTPAELIASLGAEHVIEFKLDSSASLDAAELRRLAGVSEVTQIEGVTKLTVRELHRALPALMDLLRARNETLASLTTHTATLEDVFVSLTGRQLRDE
jgi:ABC-2 type transport system ATP-binding protein